MRDRITFPEASRANETFLYKYCIFLQNVKMMLKAAAYYTKFK